MLDAIGLAHELALGVERVSEHARRGHYALLVEADLLAVELRTFHHADVRQHHRRMHDQVQVLEPGLKHRRRRCEIGKQGLQKASSAWRTMKMEL